MVVKGQSRAVGPGLFAKKGQSGAVVITEELQFMSKRSIWGGKR